MLKKSQPFQEKTKEESVAVLQCCSSKIDSTEVKIQIYIYIFIYKYIDIEVFLGHGNTLKRTATLQHCNSECRAKLSFPEYGLGIKKRK